jgi:hypothetical protein
MVEEIEVHYVGNTDDRHRHSWHLLIILVCTVMAGSCEDGNGPLRS